MSNKKDNGNTGNNGSNNSNNNNPDDSKKIDDFIAENSKFVSSREFEGEGKIFEILKVNPEAKVR